MELNKKSKIFFNTPPIEFLVTLNAQKRRQIFQFFLGTQYFFYFRDGRPSKQISWSINMSTW